MNIHLSEEAARYIQAQISQVGCRSADEFIERLLEEARTRETAHSSERHAQHLAQEAVAAQDMG